MPAPSGPGSGRFEPLREWTCSKHDWPQSHECDCRYCDRGWDCDECATAEWIDAVNEDGTPKMRELSALEVMTRDFLVGQIRDVLAKPRIDWLNDQPQPKIDGGK